MHSSIFVGMTVLKTSVFLSRTAQASEAEINAGILSGLLIEKADVAETAGLRQDLDAPFLGAFADEQEQDRGILSLQLCGRVEQSLQAVGHAHGSHITNHEFFLGAKFVA